MKKQSLKDKYRPERLADIVGQPCIGALQVFAIEPHTSCWLFVGDPGIGKSATARALAAELECFDEFSGLYIVPASELKVDNARELFECTVRMRPMFSKDGFRVVILEELESVSTQTSVYLKVALEQLCRNVVVIATSNSLTKLPEALVERFDRITFDSGEAFAEGCAPLIRRIWAEESNGAPEPIGLLEAGWLSRERFSCRVALQQIGQFLLANPGYKRAAAVA